jgi:hypothetical protein
MSHGFKDDICHFLIKSLGWKSHALNEKHGFRMRLSEVRGHKYYIGIIKYKEID